MHYADERVDVLSRKLRDDMRLTCAPMHSNAFMLWVYNAALASTTCTSPTSALAFMAGSSSTSTGGTTMP